MARKREIKPDMRALKTVFTREKADTSRIPFNTRLLGDILGKSTSQPTASGNTLKKVFSGVEEVIPYLSNIVNANRRVPLPESPFTTNLVNPVRVNFDAQRNESDRLRRGADMGAAKLLDSNSAAAVNATNLASSIRNKNQISESESTTNAGLQMQAQQINAGIEGQNTQIRNQWRRDLVDAQIAQQRNSAANIANASDKFIASRDQKALANLDLDKLSVYTKLWKDSGVYDRLIKYLKENGRDGSTESGNVFKKIHGGYLKVY